MRRLERLSLGIKAQGILGWWWLNRSDKVAPQPAYEGPTGVRHLRAMVLDREVILHYSISQPKSVGFPPLNHCNIQNSGR